MPSVISSFRGRMALIWPTPPRFDVSWLRTITKGHPVGILWTRDQLITKVATYTTQNKHKRRTSMSSSGFEPDIPAINRLHTYALRPHGHRDHSSDIWPEILTKSVRILVVIQTTQHNTTKPHFHVHRYHVHRRIIINLQIKLHGVSLNSFHSFSAKGNFSYKVIPTCNHSR
jgi:hypothetical protein